MSFSWLPQIVLSRKSSQPECSKREIRAPITFPLSRPKSTRLLARSRIAQNAEKETLTGLSIDCLIPMAKMAITYLSLFLLERKFQCKPQAKNKIRWQITMLLLAILNKDLLLGSKSQLTRTVASTTSRSSISTSSTASSSLCLGVFWRSCSCHQAGTSRCT